MGLSKGFWHTKFDTDLAKYHYDSWQNGIKLEYELPNNDFFIHSEKLVTQFITGLAMLEKDYTSVLKELKILGTGDTMLNDEIKVF